MDKITIEYDKKGNRFMVRCPFHANDIIMTAPSKRWNKAARAWALPVIRRNVEFIRLKLKGIAVCDRETATKIEEIETGFAQNAVGDEWPEQYKTKTRLKPYQETGVKRAYRRLTAPKGSAGAGAFAFYMDMGTGKTKVTIDLVSALCREGKTRSLLVVAKFSLLLNWLDELEKHCSVEYSPKIHQNSEKSFMDWMWDTKDVPLRVYLTGIESMSAGSAYTFAEKFALMNQGCVCVVDEAHMISNHKATRSERIVSLGRKTEYRIILTGTPITSGPMNTYMQFEFLDPQIIGIGDFYAFRNRYAVMGGYQRETRNGVKQPTEIIGYQNMDELVDLLSPCVYQVRKEDVLTEIPPKSFEKRVVNMTDDQRSIYKSIKKREYKWMGEHVVLKNVLELALRLHQCTGGHVATRDKEYKLDRKTGEQLEVDISVMHPIFDDPKKNPKMIEVIDILDEIGSDTPVIIWARYQNEIKDLADTISGVPGRRVGVITGSTEPPDRMEIIADFQSGRSNTIVANQETAGTGYNMTAAKVVIFYSNTFSLTHRLQAEDRAHRIGQKNAVLYIDVVVEKSVDEIVLRSIESKMDVAEYVRGRLNDGDLDL